MVDLVTANLFFFIYWRSSFHPEDGTCLQLQPGHPDLQREVTALAGVERLVVFVDQYSAAQDSLHGLRDALPQAKLVVEVRTGDV